MSIPHGDLKMLRGMGRERGNLALPSAITCEGREMTPKERAERVFTEHTLAWRVGDNDYLAKVIEAAITAAVAAEREACAKLAEDFEQVADMGGDIPPWDHIAAAIRARGET